MRKPFDITILGSNSALPAYDRYPSAQLLRYDNRLFLIDCGEGTQFKLLQLKIKLSNIQNVFISHLHGDHFFGLIGLISTMNLQGRKTPLNIYGHSSLKKVLEMQFEVSQSLLQFPLNFFPLKKTGKNLIFQDDYIEVYSFPLVHSIPTWGFYFSEKPQPLKIRKQIIEKLNIPLEKYKEIKQGFNYTDETGKTYLNHELTFEPEPLRSFAYCSDTDFAPKIVKYIENVSVLYHEATFLSDKQDSAREKMHSTAGEAAYIAKKAKAKNLIIGHFSARYKNLSDLLNEAKQIFSNTELAVESKKYPID